MLYQLMLPILLLLQPNPAGERVITYHGEEYQTTIEVENRFIGMYEGRKSGYLKLNEDGTGTYKYDIFGLAPASCKRTPINFEWGFLLDSANQIINRKRSYGYSFPILLKSTSETTFQGCRTAVIMDYILDKNGALHISSSDDWKK